jgi:hypothetical protein
MRTRVLDYFRSIFGSYKIVGRRELLDKFAGRSWQTGPEENLNYAPPTVVAGVVPARMLEFARPITLEAPFVCEIPNVELVGDVAVPFLTDNSLFYEALPCGDEKELLSASLRLKRKAKVDFEYEFAFCLVKPHSRGYFHWIMDCLLCLEGYEFYCKETGVKPLLIVDKELTPFQRDSLELMGYTEKDYVHWNAKRATVKKLVVASLRRRSEKAGVPFDAISPSALVWLRKRILAGLDAKGERDASGKIFISRSKAALRRVLNEEELMSFLAPLGFKSYCLEDLSFSEQVKLFAGAKTIVGPHGSGMTNMVWAHPGASVIELLPENRLHPDYFQLSRALGLSYTAVICKAPAGGSDITVNLAEFRKCLEGFI